MTNSTSSVSSNAVHPIRSEDLTVEEREMIRQHREQREAKLEAAELLRKLRLIEQQFGMSVKMKSCDPRLIKDPELRAERLKEEHEATIDRLRTQVNQAHALGEQRVVVISMLALAGGIMYGALLGGAAGRAGGVAEGIETAVKAAGPFGRLLRRRLEKLLQ